MPHVFSDGCRIRYESFGSGPSLVMLNYACMSIDGWNPDLLTVLSTSRRLVLVEHRGTGLSEDGAHDYDTDVLAADACSVLDDLDLDASDLLGAGLGAAVAQALALNTPMRVKRVVLIAASCGPLVAAPSKPEVWQSLNWKFEGDRDANIQRALPAYFSPSYIAETGASLAERIKPGLSKLSPQTLRRHIRALQNFDSYDRLPTLEAPVLVVHGEDDAIYPSINAHLLADRLPDGRVVIIPDAGHAVTSERPDEVAKQVLSFLDPKRLEGDV